MAETALDWFLKEEGTPHVLGVLRERLHDLADRTEHFEFNQFEVTIDGARRTVLVQDVLDPTDGGEFRTSLDEFLSAIGVKASVE